MAKILIIANGTRKSGKSTTFLNLGICFATMTQKTLLVDLNRHSWVEGLCISDQRQGVTELNMFLSYTNTSKVDFDLFDSFDQVLIDCPVHLNAHVFKVFSGLAKVLIPIELEFYGLNELPSVLREADRCEIGIAGFLPVMAKPGVRTNDLMLEKLESNFGNSVFSPTIQRNYYLARQKDFDKFILSELSAKAAVTYLSVANTLLYSL